jgi:hypothetical protein
MKLTILMYHKIDELPNGVRHPGNYVRPAEFERQMDALLAWGYRTIRFEQWIDDRDSRSATALPEKPLIVTFDDGYTCFDAHAWPALRARGMNATVFLVSGQIGGTNAWESDEIALPLLDATRILALQSEGVHFASHSVTHRALVHIPAEEAREELARSRTQLASSLAATSTCSPIRSATRTATYESWLAKPAIAAPVRGKGRMNSPTTDLFGLRRIKVEPTTTVESLERTLARERRRWFL